MTEPVEDPPCECGCGCKARTHPELAGGKGRMSCGKAGCPCVRYRPKYVEPVKLVKVDTKPSNKAKATWSK